MDIAYLYSKARTEFGKAVRFDDEVRRLPPSTNRLDE
jgi:hypothetical protein